ncbi:MAG: ABC transporter substrate-binding protein [Muribaculaceae bacterium]|nr:ABC transporter substrate-binding protein [Muribaculaceae bacterium]
MSSNLRILFFLPTLLLSLGCSRSGNSGAEGCVAEIPLRHAKYLTLSTDGDATIARISNPWDSSAVLATLILLPDTAEMPEQLPQGKIVRVPLKNSLVYSSVHVGLIKELGHMDAVKGVCDANFIADTAVLSEISSKSIIDCGNSMAPDLERIIALSPDAILLSPYENSLTNSRLESIGIPIIQCADYMEATPLARAEWMKFFGLLYGGEAVADSIFAEVESKYLAVKSKATGTASRPSVIFDGIYSNQWYMPGHNTTTATYIRDAGGTNPFDDIATTGSVALSPENVLVKARNADYWLVRYASASNISLPDFLAQNRIYKEFEAAKKNKVLFCNTIYSPFFDETPFHPELFLTNLADILHPELGLTPERQYFTTP